MDCMDFVNFLQCFCSLVFRFLPRLRAVERVYLLVSSSTQPGEYPSKEWSHNLDPPNREVGKIRKTQNSALGKGEVSAQLGMTIQHQIDK